MSYPYRNPAFSVGGGVVGDTQMFFCVSTSSQRSQPMNWRCVQTFPYCLSTTVDWFCWPFLSHFLHVAGYWCWSWREEIRRRTWSVQLQTYILLQAAQQENGRQRRLCSSTQALEVSHKKNDAFTAFAPLPWGAEVKSPAAACPFRLPKPAISLPVHFITVIYVFFNFSSTGHVRRGRESELSEAYHASTGRWWPLSHRFEGQSAIYVRHGALWKQNSIWCTQKKMLYYPGNFMTFVSKIRDPGMTSKQTSILVMVSLWLIFLRSDPLWSLSKVWNATSPEPTSGTLLLRYT